MDFARKQLEKYGWTDGKGLGKNENGISEALKPKLKRSVTGIGHDAAADFTEHWWNTLYDKAASNIEVVKNKNGKTKKIEKRSAEFEITNSTWRLNKKQENIHNDGQYSEYFVKTAVLSSGGSKTDNLRVDSESERESEKRDVFKMTDEALFAACGGRTGHKGARHGLKALGKLARIERQEQLLLILPKYEGYSHAKKVKKENSTANDSEVVEDTNLYSDREFNENIKKRKKHCNKVKTLKLFDNVDVDMADCLKSKPHEKSKTVIENVASVDMEECDGRKSKSKKSKRKNVYSENSEVNMDVEIEEHENVSKPNKKKKKLKNLPDNDS